MKNKIAVLTITACFAGLTLCGQSSERSVRLDSGLEFRLPAGWQMQASGAAATLVPASAVQGAEVYFAGVMVGMRDVNDPQLIASLVSQHIPAKMQARRDGSPVAFRTDSGNGFVHTYSLADGATQYVFDFYVVGLRGGNVAGLIAGAQPALRNLRRAEVQAIAASLSAGSAAAAQPAAVTNRPVAAGSQSSLVSTWMQRLSDKKLVQMSSYNSGGGSGGMSSERKLYLASDGSYAYRSSSSVSIYVPGATGSSAGRNADDGRWNVVEQGGRAMLELVSKNGTREAIVLSMEGDKTFLNGRRWFRVGINE